MTTASTAARHPQPADQSERTRAAQLLFGQPLAIPLVVLAFAIGLHARGTVDADVAWQLWIGRQLNHGAHLYRDIIDTNPPLWFWMAMPVDLLSRLTQLRIDHLLILLIGCFAALALVMTDQLIDTMSRPRRTVFLAYASLALVALPWLEVGQREHIALIATLPYAALTAARSKGRTVSVTLAVAIGMFAAVGFALKHYFLIVPILLESWLLANHGRKWRPIRPETAAMFSVGIVYGIAILVTAQRYLTFVVPMLLLAYGATGAKHVVDLFQPAVLAAIASILLLLASPRLLRSESSGIASALTIAALGFAVVYFVQAKGWSYHAVPMVGCSAMALAACMSGGANPPRAMLLAGPALLCLPFTIAAQLALREPQSEENMAHALQGMRAGESVAFIAADPSFGWHFVVQRNLRFPLRYNGFWMMQAVVNNETAGGTDPRLSEIGARVVRETVADLECRPPQRIIFARPTAAAARAGDFDIFSFFLRDAHFARLLAHYRPVERTSVEEFVLQTPLARPRGCSIWSPS